MRHKKTSIKVLRLDTAVLQENKEEGALKNLKMTWDIADTFEFQTDIITVGFSTPDNPSLVPLCTLQLLIEAEKKGIEI